MFAVGDKATLAIFPECGTVGVPAAFGGRREKVRVRLMGEEEVCEEGEGKGREGVRGPWARQRNV